MHPKEILNDEVKAAIIEDCNVDTTKERCGFILRDLSVVPVENIHPEAEYKFAPAQQPFDELEDEIIAMYHSHNKETEEGILSAADIQQSRLSGIPYILYHTVTGAWDYFDPNYIHPYPLMEKGDPTDIDYLVGIPFAFGRSDCAWLVRAYCKLHHNFEIIDHARPMDGEWFKEESKNSVNGLYYDLFDQHEGLTEINTDRPQRGDILLFRAFGSRTANHTAIVIDPAKGDRPARILHTLERGLVSSIIPWVNTMRSNPGSLHSVWRIG